MNMFKSWKTLAMGIVTVASGIVLLFNGQNTEGLAAVTGGLGLIFAKDGNVTGGSTKQ